MQETLSSRAILFAEDQSSIIADQAQKTKSVNVVLASNLDEWSLCEYGQCAFLLKEQPIDFFIPLTNNSAQNLPNSLWSWPLVAKIKPCWSSYVLNWLTLSDILVFYGADVKNLGLFRLGLRLKLPIIVQQSASLDNEVLQSLPWGARVASTQMMVQAITDTIYN